jgi:hypothetical protein
MESGMNTGGGQGNAALLAALFRKFMMSVNHNVALCQGGFFRRRGYAQESFGN